MIHRELFVYSVGVPHAAFSQPAREEALLQEATPLARRPQNDSLPEGGLATSAAEATKTNFPAHDCGTSSSPPTLTAI